jgi:hypothetical protein
MYTSTAFSPFPFVTISVKAIFPPSSSYLPLSENKSVVHSLTVAPGVRPPIAGTLSLEMMDYGLANALTP